MNRSSQEHLDRWLSVDEIAIHLGITRDTVYKWIGRWGMPAHKVGRLWKFRKQEVDEWVLSYKRPRPVEGTRSQASRGRLHRKLVGGRD